MDNYKELAKTKNLARAYFLVKYALSNNATVYGKKVESISISQRGIYLTLEDTSEDKYNAFLGKNKDLLPCDSLQTLRYNFTKMFTMSAETILEVVKPVIDKFLTDNDPYYNTLEQTVEILKEYDTLSNI